MCFILTNCYGIINHMKVLLCNLIFLVFISSCSKQIQEINVSCQTDSLHDESLTFNFETNKVYISKILNKYGYETKKIIEDRSSPEYSYKSNVTKLFRLSAIYLAKFLRSLHCNCGFK